MPIYSWFLHLPDPTNVPTSLNPMFFHRLLEDQKPTNFISTVFVKKFVQDLIVSKSEYSPSWSRREFPCCPIPMLVVLTFFCFTMHIVNYVVLRVLYTQYLQTSWNILDQKLFIFSKKISKDFFPELFVKCIIILMPSFFLYLIHSDTFEIIT